MRIRRKFFRSACALFLVGFELLVSLRGLAIGLRTLAAAYRSIRGLRVFHPYRSITDSLSPAILSIDNDVSADSRA